MKTGFPYSTYMINITRKNFAVFMYSYGSTSALIDITHMGKIHLNDQIVVLFHQLSGNSKTLGIDCEFNTNMTYVHECSVLSARNGEYINNFIQLCHFQLNYH